ncbi:MAG: leucyl/phenylalanyl-tRNA--protein transferase [Myxococcales bacterium]|nr:MAG: leucyl/phenylalanyl-tRNA--protein transferase [Myxococcales bacterium]
MVPLLGSALIFPPPESAGPEGLVAIGGDLSVERLILAYSQGIFPWPHHGLPLLWFSPDPRYVLEPGQVHLSRSLKRRIRKQPFEIRFDTAFSQVISACAAVPRPGQQGTWITDEMREGYEALHERGFAHSIEAWQGDRLVGGLYGVALGSMFFGETMFAIENDASKIAFITLLGHLIDWDYTLVDCQSYTEHLERFGAKPWPRDRFLAYLRNAVSEPGHIGPWTLELSPEQCLNRIETCST